MPDTYVIDVDMERLKAHRSAIEQRPLTDEDVRRWLISFGFYPRIDGLYVAEDNLLQKLDPDEILAARRVGTILH